MSDGKIIPRFLLAWILAFMAWPVRAPLHPGSAAADLPVFSDSLAAGWQDWSWNSLVSFSNTGVVHGGQFSIAVTYSQGWDGFQLGRQTTLDLTGYTSLRFWVRAGGSGGQTVQVSLTRSASVCMTASRTVTLTSSWQQVDIPLADLGSPAQVTTLQWFNNTPNSQAVFYLDDIAFVSGTPAPPPPQALPGPALNLDAAANRHPISPLVYGINFASESLAAELKLPLRRWGGNATTRYNWQNDTSNHASDWFFENIPNNNPNPAQLPNGSSSDLFVEQDRRTGTQTLLTVPLIGWTPKSRADDCGFSVQKYGAQDSVDSWRPDCGSGVHNGVNLSGNDPADTSTAIGPGFVRDWIAHLIGRYGAASQGGVAFYNLDNEPMLWNSTHRDVHPQATSYDELKQRTIDYAAAIKTADPSAQTLGPVLWGWTAYFYSAKDQTDGGPAWWNTRPDRMAHGDIPFLTWYLQQMKAYQDQNGRRILDYLDVHFYPKGTGVFSASPGDANTQALRLRSTRALWDPAYKDESWINDQVKLIPRLRDWVNQNYPGTKTALSEYSWGALCHVNGALAQADILGIFGREQLDLAALWDPPASNQPGAFAFRIYRNYDGAGAEFGDQSVSAQSADPGKLSIFAAQRSSDGALTVTIINKTATDLTSAVDLQHFLGLSTAQAFRYSANPIDAIQALPPQQVGSGSFSATFAANSITLWVIPLNRNLPDQLFLPAVQR